MEKIKFIADSACDIPDSALARYQIDLPSVPIAIEGVEYWERKSFSMLEFYDVLAKTKEIPTTSRVPSDDFLSCYQKAFDQQFTDIICVTINASGSGTNASAQMAAAQFFENNPQAVDKIRIHIVDSRTYAMAYGYPVVQAAMQAEKGRSVASILEYLEDYFSCCEIYLACYTLDYAKKSGRINAAAAFVGDVLGLRPIISLIDGNTKIIDKVRGEKQLGQRLLASFDQNCTDPDAPVLVVCGEVREYGEQLQAQLQKKLDRKVPIYQAGASIVINAGPNIAAFVCRGKQRPGSIQIAQFPHR